HVAGDPEGSEPRSMRKFYRFSVMNPVSVNPVCTAVRGSPFVEVQLVNTTQQMDLLLESCRFIPEGGVEASLLGGGEGGDPLAASPWDEDNETADTAGDGRAQPPLQGEGEAGSGGVRTSTATTKWARRRDRWWKGGGGNGRGPSPGGGAAAEGKAPPHDDRCLLTAVERFDGRVLLRPEEGHQLMYSVRPKEETTPPPPGKEGYLDAVGGAARAGGDAGVGGFGEGSHTLGRVQVCWRTTTGESGSIRGGPVVFEAPDRPEVEVS
ncbi:unnamed protein product, partial [Ectocarpus sp. 8 AP-2014]